jgi:twitching motility two-component system response regulator PilH
MSRLGAKDVHTAGVLSGRRVLVVDDEPDALTFISTVLEDNGADTLHATNGADALDLARRERPDLITLDLSMPGKSGIAVFRELRSDQDLMEIPICIITGRPEMRELIYQNQARRPEGYIEKPLDEESLLRNVRKILRVGHQRHDDA